MSTARPKLLVLAGPDVPSQGAATWLLEHFEPHFSSASPTDAIRDVDPALVLASAGVWEADGAEGAGRVLAAIGFGAALCTRSGDRVWGNVILEAYRPTTLARIAEVCRLASERFDQAAIKGDLRDDWTERFDVASADEDRHYEVIVAPVGWVEGGGGSPRTIERVAIMVWDVTAARRLSQKIDAINRAGAELVRLDAASIRRKHVGERLRVLEEKIVRTAHELLHFDHFLIRLVEEKTQRLDIVMMAGLPPEAEEIELEVAAEGNGIMGYVAATGASYLCRDVRTDPLYKTGLYAARSSLTIPLVMHDQVIGVLNVESDQEEAFGLEDLRFGEMFANHVALALHILDLLVVERCATGETVTGTVEGELDEPLEDILSEADWLKEEAGRDPKLQSHIDRIRSDVEAIRKRVREVASGPATILGANKALRESAQEPAMVGRRVLVADDEARIRQTIRDVLTARGCTVEVCANGAEAAATIEQHADTPFELIISDIKMPDKNGYEVFSVARRIDPEARVILMTGFGYDPHHSIVRASQDGLQCVLFKPFQVERLMDEVRKALGIDAEQSTG